MTVAGTAGTGLSSSYSSRRDHRSYSRSPPRLRTGYYRFDNDRNTYRNEYGQLDRPNGSRDDRDGYSKRWNDDGKEGSKGNRYYSERGREFDYRRERTYSGSSASQVKRYDQDGGNGQRGREQVVDARPIQHYPSTMPSSSTATNSSHPVPSNDYSMFVNSTSPHSREERRDERDERDENRGDQSRDYMGYCDDRSWSDGNKEKWKEEIARRYVQLEMMRFCPVLCDLIEDMRWNG